MKFPERPTLKFGAVAIVSLIVVGLRFAWLDQQQAAEWVINGSYWILLALLGAGAGWGLREWRAARRRWRDVLPGAGVLAFLAGLALVLQLHEPHRLKVSYDEHVLVGISRSMHFEHLAAWPGGAHRYHGTVTPTSLMADKRPVLFPFAVSLLHNVTGYRVENVYVVNGLVSFALLAGLFFLGRRYHATHGGLLFAALLAGVPLVAQNATGGGFDLLNATLIVLLAIGVRRYVENPDGRSLELITLVSLGLANTRYESVAYMAVPAVVFVYVGWRARAMPRLPWTLAFAPLGLLPALLSNAVFQSSDTFFQANGAAFWAWSYLPENLSHAVYYLFDPARGGTNSVWLAALGMAAMAAILFVLRRQTGVNRPLRPETIALVVVGGGIAFNTGVALGLRWGAWDDPLVSRFSLPFWVLLGWLVLEVARHLEEEHRWTAVKPLTYASVAMVLLFAVPDASQARATHKLKAGTALAWALDVLEQHDPDRSALVLANSAIPYINEGYPALPLDKSLIRFPNYASTLEYGLYTEVLIVLEERRNPKDGQWVADGKHDDLITRVRVERVARTVLDPFYRMTIYRVVKPDDPAAVIPWPASEPGDELYQRRVYDLLP